jgi:dihydroorotate dehydrogenase
VRLFDRRIESPVGIAAGPLINSKWLLAYARLGYGILTYRTVRTVERAAFPQPNLVSCRLGDPTVIEPHAPRRIDPGDVTWVVSLGHPSPAPAVWRTDVARARAKLDSHQVLVVSVMGTPMPGGDSDHLAADYAQCARWAAEAGGDVIEVLLSCPHIASDPGQMVSDNPSLAAHVVEQVRRAVGLRPVIAKVGAAPSPRTLHELATRVAPWLDGFTLVDGLQRRVVKPDGTPALPGPEREVGRVAGGAVWDQCRVQVEELLAWRKAGAWDRVVLALGGITTVDRARAALAAGAEAAMIATAALTDPLLAVNLRRRA